MATVRFSKVVEKAGRPEVYLLWMDPAKDVGLQRALKAHRVMTVHQATAGTGTDRGEVGLAKGASGQLLVFPRSLKSFEGRSVVGVKYDLLAEPPPEQMRPAKKVAPPKAKVKAPPEKEVTDDEPESGSELAIKEGKKTPKEAPAPKPRAASRQKVNAAKKRPVKAGEPKRVAKANTPRPTKTKTTRPTKTEPEAEEAARKIVKFPHAPKAKPTEKRSPASPVKAEVELKKVRATVRRAMRALERGQQVAAFRLLEGIVEG